MKVAKVLEHSFLREPLRKSKIVLDCGGNRGHFSRWISINTPAFSHCFEPDGRLFSQLESEPRIKYHKLAIDGTSGWLELAHGINKCSSAIYREDASQTVERVEKITLAHFCKTNEIDRIDLLKLDIEGSELSVLRNATPEFLGICSQITVEFHDFLDIRDRPAIREIRDRMRSMGFLCIRFSHFTWGDCLFINRSHLPIGMMELVRIKIRYKLVPGLFRLLRRLYGA